MRLKYAVIGTGAIGGYYGGKLARAGQDVHFLLHSDYDHVKENGLRIDSTDGNFHIPDPNAYHKTADMPVCDVILVALKSTNNALLKELLPPLLHKNTVVILIQNGLGLEADLQKDFPDLNIAGGLAFICSAKKGPGHIAHYDEGKINMGSYSCTDDSILKEVCSDFRNAGVKTNLLELETARWMKLVWNIPYNGMTVVMNATTDQLMNNPSMEGLLYELMLEVVRGANHVGKGRFTIPESYAKEILDMTRTMTPYSPSMKLDYDFKRPMEIDYIYTRPIIEALKAGYKMSKVEMLEKQLRYLEAQNRK